MAYNATERENEKRAKEKQEQARVRAEAEAALPTPRVDTNIRRNGDRKVRFNIPPPAFASKRWTGSNYTQVMYSSTQRGQTGRAKYRDDGFNERGMIVRDFNMQDKLNQATSGWNSATGGKRGDWGFQFHFNPPEVIESFSAPMGMDYAGFILDIARNPLLVTSTQTGASVNFNILLSRFEDMRVLTKPNWKSYYPNSTDVTDEDRDMILAWGTQYDLEFLFRVVNLDPVNTWRDAGKADTPPHLTRTSDWGMLMGTPVVVSLGDSEGCRKYRGSIRKLGVQHQQFIHGMIPVYTIVQFEMTRITDMYGLASKNDGGNDSGAGGGESNAGNPGGAYATSGGGVNLPSSRDKTWRSPVAAELKVSRGFKHRDPKVYSSSGGLHTGIDFQLPEGRDTYGEPVHAVADGAIEFIQNGTDLGLELVLNTGQGVFAAYCHLDRLSKSWRAGDKVVQGEILGRVGRSGIMSSATGAHLHFEVRNSPRWRNDISNFQDPAQWIVGRSSTNEALTGESL